ncbi:MAG TPA: NmrA/HSCARG family protein [Candidatus Kapabacteria bacterium]|jgi:uncharacterized protein YbjT (DUF2867 family)
MFEKKTIVVFGATGAQGGGLARAILNDNNSEFAVRAVTRDPNSDKAKALAAMGAEIVSANIDDGHSMTEALRDAYGAYFVTFFWTHFSPEKEMAEAKQMAEAAKATCLKHIIWSTLEDVRTFVPIDDPRLPTLHDRYKVPHFDGKGASDDYFTQSGVPTTFILPSFYWDNILYFGMGPKRGVDGKLTISLPMGSEKLAGIAAEDIGKCAYGIFKKGTSLAGKRVGVAGDQRTISEMANAIGSAIGEDVAYNEITPEVYRRFGFPGADDLANMWQFYRDFADECNHTRDVTFSRELNPELQSFEMWLDANAKRIPLG